MGYRSSSCGSGKRQQLGKDAEAAAAVIWWHLQLWTGVLPQSTLCYGIAMAAGSYGFVAVGGAAYSGTLSNGGRQLQQFGCAAV
jgi:hypothetical protein